MSSPDLEREVSDLRAQVSDLKEVVALSAMVIADVIYMAAPNTGGSARVSTREQYVNKLKVLVPAIDDE